MKPEKVRILDMNDVPIVEGKIMEQHHKHDGTRIIKIKPYKEWLK